MYGFTHRISGRRHGDGDGPLLNCRLRTSRPPRERVVSRRGATMGLVAGRRLEKGESRMSDTPAVDPGVPDDRDLLARLRAADPAARRELYDRLHAKLRGHFERTLPDRQDAEECTNEVLVRALEGIADGSAPESIDKCVWGIARPVRFEQYRAGGTRPVAQADSDDRDEHLADRSPTGHDPGFGYGKREAFAAIHTVTARLGTVQRQVMTAYLAESLLVMDEVKGEQLAAKLGEGWTPARVNRELDRARDKVCQDVGVLGVARSARSCAEAIEIVGGEPDLASSLSSGLWSTLARHAEGCPTCRPIYQRS